jgi:crotonobetaine/carnitine-CoA ligase
VVVPDFLRARVESSPDNPFLYFNDRVISFGDMDRRSDRAAGFLESLGVRKGDKVCLMLSNRPEFLDLWFGLAKLCAVMVPLNTSLKGDGFAYIVNHSDASIFVLEGAFVPVFEKAAQELKKIRTKVFVGDKEGMPGGFVGYDDAVAAFPAGRTQRVVIQPSDVMSIMYTSGTTGLPKGAMISHFNYPNTGKIWEEIVVRANSDDVFFTTLPLFHANAQMFTTMGSVSSGRPMVLREKFSASRFFDEIRQYGATVFNYIGAMLTILMKQPPRPDDADNPARITFGGAAPKEIWREFEKRFGVTIMEGFGLTESGGVCLANPYDRIKVGSIGKPLPFCDVKVVDDYDVELPAGISGEIVVRTKVPDAIFLEYYKDSQRTRESMRGGWFHSGDRGYVDEEGYFYFLDRMKDCIRRRGENISSFEIEKAINAHPKVLESAAIGVPSELGEEDVKVFVVPREGSVLGPDEIVEWCADRIAYFMVPRYIEFLEAFPKTATERTQKYELRKRPPGVCWDREKKEFVKPC